MSVAFCGLTAVLGSAPLVVLRNNEGRWAFLLATFVATAVLLLTKSYGLAIPFVLSTMLVYVFVEGIELGAGIFRSAFTALSLGSGASLIGLVLWAKHQNALVTDVVRQQLKELLASLPQMQPQIQVQLDLEHLLQMMPSAIVILMAVSLWIGVLFGQKFSNLGSQSKFARLKPRDFDVPEAMVWVLILSLPGAFLSPEGSLTQIVAMNVFNLMAFIYFLKGLAVIGTYFFASRMSVLWKSLFYVVLISQLFLLVSILGLVDVWLNLKVRLVKKSTEESIKR